jgi:thiol-disulfide isomerase/thioredoxin
VNRVTAILVVGVIAAQVAAVALYGAVERSRRDEAPFRHERLNRPAPPLRLVRGEEPVAAPAAQRVTVVHFWATWCGPCQVELPALIAAAAVEGASLVAVTEEPWSDVERWFDGEVPAVVVRDPTGRADEAWSVSGLPDTYRVRDGQIDGRVGGPRVWDSSDARAWLRGATR